MGWFAAVLFIGRYFLFRGEGSEVRGKGGLVRREGIDLFFFLFGHIFEALPLVFLHVYVMILFEGGL